MSEENGECEQQRTDTKRKNRWQQTKMYNALKAQKFAKWLGESFFS